MVLPIAHCHCLFSTSCFKLVRCRAFIAYTIDIFRNHFMSRFLLKCFELFLAPYTKTQVLVTMLLFDGPGDKAGSSFLERKIRATISSFIWRTAT